MRRKSKRKTSLNHHVASLTPKAMKPAVDQQERRRIQSTSVLRTSIPFEIKGFCQLRRSSQAVSLNMS